MTRPARFAPLAFALALALLVAPAASAQLSPGPGPWSAGHPLWFDLNGDGIPQGSELTGYPTYDGEGCTQVVGIPTEVGAPSSPCAEVAQDGGIFGSIQRPGGRRQTLETNAAGTQFTYGELEGDFELPAGGTGLLLDVNGDGIFDTLQVEGQRTSGPVPQTRMSLLLRDVTGDGRPDYITVPWTTSGAGMLGVFTSSTPPIHVPLSDTNSDGWPDTITVQVAGGGVTTTTGPALSGPALLAGVNVPSASTLGLVVFAAAVVALGLKLLRGTAVAG